MTGAFAGLALGLLLVIFGFWKTLLVVALAVLGYVLGVHIFSNTESFRNFLDKILPPGRFR